MNRRDEILAQIELAPAIPVSAMDLVDLLDDPNFNIDSVASLMEKDPGLTANVLRLANSAAVAGITPVQSVQEAVVRLGAEQICHFAMISAVSTLANRPIQGYDLSPEKFIRHSIAVANGAPLIAKALGLEVAPYLYTAGILHNIGKVVLGTFVGVSAAPIGMATRNQDLSFEEAEREILGIDHAETGALLLQQWNFPPEIIEVVRWHHEPEKVSGDPTAVEMIHLADVLSLEGGIGLGDVEGLNYRACPNVLARNELTMAMRESIVCQMLVEVEAVVA